MNLELYQAKLNIMPMMFAEVAPKEDILLFGLQSPKIIENRNRKFMFANVEKASINGSIYMYGTVVKYADVTEEVANEETHQVDNTLVDDKIIAKSHFIIDLLENVIFYSEVKNHINKNSFINIFSDLLNAGLHEKNIEVELIAINESYSFIKQLESYFKIVELELTVFPTNPFPGDIIKEMDEKLKAQGVKKKIIKYKAKEPGLIIDEDIRKESTYTDIGYGKGYALCEDKDGKRKKIYSKKSEKQKKTKPISFDKGPFGLMEELSNLLERM